MPGPLPKPPEQRRRRNAVAGVRVLPHTGRPGPVPELPDREVEIVHEDGDSTFVKRDWPEMVVGWWEQAWRSPMAVVWAENPTDFFALVRLAALMAEAMSGDTRAAAEARQLEDRLGLSPLSRRRLQWEIEPPELEAIDAPRPPETTLLEAAELGEPGFDPRRLRAVE